MRGHEQLIDLRRTGFVPEWVWIDTDPDPLETWRDWRKSDNRHARILIEDSDKRFDLRCVIGLKVYIDGLRLERVHEVRDACIAAGADRVIASVMNRIGRDEFVAFQLLECTDTAGQMSMEAEAIRG